MKSFNEWLKENLQESRFRAAMMRMKANEREFQDKLKGLHGEEARKEAEEKLKKRKEEEKNKTPKSDTGRGWSFVSEK